MTWNPNPVVTIDGVDFTGEALNGVNITMGRPSVWSQPRSGYCTIDLVNLNDSIWNLNINDPVTVQVDDSAGNPVTLFTGKLMSSSSRVDFAGSTADVVITTVTAIGPMAEMSRVNSGGSAWAKEYDDDRMDRILTASGVTIDIIDTPGVYEFTAVTPDVQDTYTLATKYAQMAFGYIYETADGKVGYANESRRTLDRAANGYLSIPTNVILGRSVSSELSFKDLLNDIVLVWKNNQTKTASSAASITAYGEAAAKIITELEDGAQAQNQADRYITLRAMPQTNLNSFTVQLDTPAMTNSLLDDLLAIELGLPIQIAGLPP